MSKIYTQEPTEIPGAMILEGMKEVEEQVTTDVEQTELPDGGVEINFDPRTKLNGQQPEGHFDNLAEALDDSILSKLGSDMHANYTDYKNM